MKIRVRRREAAVFKLDMSEESWDWFSVFLASAAISGLYYIANPSDRSTTTQHLFRNPPFMLTLSGSSNKIHWWIAKNIHLIMSYKSAAWNVITAFRRGEMDQRKQNLRRHRLRCLEDIWHRSGISGQSARWLSSARACCCARHHIATSHRWLSEGRRPANGLVGCIVGNVFKEQTVQGCVCVSLWTLFHCRWPHNSDQTGQSFHVSTKSLKKCDIKGASIKSVWANQPLACS